MLKPCAGSLSTVPFTVVQDVVSPAITVSWSGDDGSGTGVVTYDVQVRAGDGGHEHVHRSGWWHLLLPGAGVGRGGQGGMTRRLQHLHARGQHGTEFPRPDRGERRPCGRRSFLVR